MENRFDIPVVLFLFKRSDTVLQIIDRIRQVRPTKMILMSDGGRNAEECKMVEQVRRTVEEAIDWDCEIVKDYAQSNRGVYANIGLGALRVFEKEERAIFLEDDNLPEVSFFDYCRELLNTYQTDTRVLWICGTNYLEKYAPENGADYMFTQQLLPCGWASWREKFTRFYDKTLESYKDPYIRRCIRDSYQSKPLYRQQMASLLREAKRAERGERYGSWDYHMLLSVKANGLYGIAPANNQIKNIGVDACSIHNGTSMANIMTKRFCGIDTTPLHLPLNHPATVLPDAEFEKQTTKIVLMPLKYRVRATLVKLVKIILGKPVDQSIHRK